MMWSIADAARVPQHRVDQRTERLVAVFDELVGPPGGCDQSWPSWLNSSGGAPAVTPSASTSCSAHASAPFGSTPTARSCMMPSAMPARTARRLRRGQLLVELPLQPAVKIDGVGVLGGEVGDRGASGCRAPRAS